MLSTDNNISINENSANKEVQQKVSLKILSNIAQKGLLPGCLMVKQNEGFLSSSDCGTNPYIPKHKHLPAAFNNIADTLRKKSGGFLCVNELSLQAVPKSQWAARFKNLMNEISCGAWPIILEREYKLSVSDTKALVAEFNERLKFCVLFVLKPQAAAFSKRTFVDSNKTNNPDFLEKRLEQGISPEHILAILAPQHLKDLVQQVFPSTRVQVVGFKNESIMIPLFEVEKYWPTRIFSPDPVKSTLSVPDFDSGLKEFAEKESSVFASNNSTICTHVLRLPTLKDIEYNLACGRKHLEQAGASFSNIPLAYALYCNTYVEIQRDNLRQKLQLQEGEELRIKEARAAEEFKLAEEKALAKEEAIQSITPIIQSAIRGKLVRVSLQDYRELHKTMAQQHTAYQIEAYQDNLPKLIDLREKLHKLK